MNIKQITEEDFEDLKQLFIRNNVDAIRKWFSPFPLTEESARDIACNRHLDKFYLGISNNEIVGFSMLRGWEEGYSIPSFGMFIDQYKQGHGYGKQLLDLTIDEGKKLCCEKIMLNVFAENKIALYIYISREFVEIKRSFDLHTNNEVINMIKVIN